MSSHKKSAAILSRILAAVVFTGLFSESGWAQVEEHAGHTEAPSVPSNADVTQGVEDGRTKDPQPVPAELSNAGRESRADTEERDPHAYSSGYTLESGPYALPGPRTLRLADEHHFGSLLVERLERIDTENANSTAYDVQAWFGRDFNRLVLKAEGDYAGGRLEDARTEALWSHAIASYWDAQLGVRYDNGVGPDRGWLAFGIQGLAPYWFDVEATGYIGESGRTALRFSALYDFLLSQRLILQPRAEINWYGKDDEARDIGSGLSTTQIGIRLRYEISRQFAPYVGVEWAGKFGDTADFARAANEDKNETRWMIGFRAWF